MNNKYIAYYRVSTEDQGKSGLGLQDQKHIVEGYVSDNNGDLVASYQDIETGKSISREGFKAAVDHAKSIGAILAVKEPSRIARLSLGESYELLGGTKYVDCSSPQDSQILKDIKMSMAGEEVRKISERTTAALSVIQRKLERGEVHVSKTGKVVTRLGNPENLSDVSRLRSIEVRKEKAKSDSSNKRATAFILSLKEQGNSFYKITKMLNEAGFKTSRGNNFSQVQTKNLYSRGV